LQLLAFSGIFVAINSVFGTLMRVKHRIKGLIVISCIISVLILGESYLLADQGLVGIGYAWIVGQAIVSVVYLGFWAFGRK
jgi:O-antigen/teichoic acid export membrane protein